MKEFDLAILKIHGKNPSNQPLTNENEIGIVEKLKIISLI